MEAPGGMIAFLRESVLVLVEGTEDDEEEAVGVAATRGGRAGLTGDDGLDLGFGVAKAAAF